MYQKVREVKKLDSDMQMLVYENYNKFISATDTIRKMAQNVEGMEAEMADLKGSMDRISNSSATVNASLEGEFVRSQALFFALLGHICRGGSGEHDVSGAPHGSRLFLSCLSPSTLVDKYCTLSPKEHKKKNNHAHFVFI